MSLQKHLSAVCVSGCARGAAALAGSGSEGGQRHLPGNLRPGQRTSGAAGCSGAPGFAEKHTSFNLSEAERWKYFLRFSFHFFIYRNIICSGLSQHNKSMERRGITWLYRFQKQKVILHTMNLYILENLKCQSS